MTQAHCTANLRGDFCLTGLCWAWWGGRVCSLLHDYGHDRHHRAISLYLPTIFAGEDNTDSVTRVFA